MTARTNRRPSEPLPLRDKVVVITGAGSGIGRALALDVAARGAVPAISDVDAPGLQETADLVHAATGRRAHVDKLDVRDRAAWEAYAASVLADLGRADVIVNNAGVALSGDVDKVSHEQFELLVDIDFWGVVHGTRTFLPHVIASGDGHVVNVSSLFGLLSVPGQSAYNAAKFAVRGFTESLRQEMLVARHPVKVTCVHPGGIKTAVARNATYAEGIDAKSAASMFDRKLAIHTPEMAAQTIVEGVRKGQGRVLIGWEAKLLDLFVRVTASGYQRIAANVERRFLP